MRARLTGSCNCSSWTWIPPGGPLLCDVLLKSEPDTNRSHPGGLRLLLQPGDGAPHKMLQIKHGKKNFSDELNDPFLKSFFHDWNRIRNIQGHRGTEKKEVFNHEIHKKHENGIPNIGKIGQESSKHWKTRRGCRVYVLEI